MCFYCKKPQPLQLDVPLSETRRLVENCWFPENAAVRPYRSSALPSHELTMTFQQAKSRLLLSYFTAS